MPSAVALVVAACPARDRRMSKATSPDDVGCVAGHGLADVDGVEQSVVVDGQLAKVAEVFDVAVGRKCPDERGGLE